MDRGGRHIGEVVAAAMRAVHLQEAEDATFHLTAPNPLVSSRKGLDSEGASVVKHLRFGDGHTRGRESDPVRHREARDPPLDSLSEV